uniref:Uncharacterized protein n=2 Tax=Clytia hemisphaerica TaxID=252671 RepID=A0A7M5V886_9CNID
MEYICMVLLTTMAATVLGPPPIPTTDESLFSEPPTPETETPTPPIQPPSNDLPCRKCFEKADSNGQWWVPCRVSYSECTRRGVDVIFAGHGWFFLHCGENTAWCKPCAGRNLVYNPNCGRCDWSRDARCCKF